MKVLIISANILPSSPSGPAYVAGAARSAGHTVEVFECLFAKDLVSEVEERINGFKPDVIGISFRLVTGDIIDESVEFKTKFLLARISDGSSRGDSQGQNLAVRPIQIPSTVKH
jgi:hypothetical protein